MKGATSALLIFLVTIPYLAFANFLEIRLVDPATRQERITNNLAKFVPQGFDVTNLCDVCEVCPNAQVLLHQREFDGRPNSHIVVPVPRPTDWQSVVLVGIGERKKGRATLAIEIFRRAVGSLIRACQQNKIKDISVELPKAELFGVSKGDLVKEFAIISQLTQYSFDRFLTNPSSFDLRVQLVCDRAELVDIDPYLQEGFLIGQSVNATRQLVDLPANYCTPTYLAEQAASIAQSTGLAIRVYTESEVIAMGMGGLAAVSRGSDEECRFVVMEYHYDQTAPTIGLVGKGVTHDAGGLNVKMHGQEFMKVDMGGAGAVIGAMSALGQLKPKVNVVALLAMTENLLGAKAYHPGDVITFYNGKTAEIINTDAEGRLIMADALAYGVKNYQLDLIVDLATLTGACKAALGHFYSGLMSEHDDMVERFLCAADRTGDRVWRLPLHADYKASLKSEVADFTNLGSSRYAAGATTAGMFLQNFVEDTPWVHLDIAGSSWNVPDIPYFNKTASGAGVRLLIDLLMNW